MLQGVAGVVNYCRLLPCVPYGTGKQVKQDQCVLRTGVYYSGPATKLKTRDSRNQD